MIELSFSNLAVYSAQILFIVLAAEAGVRLTGISAPGLRLTYWRAVVASCLALPFVTATRPPAVAIPAQVSAVTEVTGAVAGSNALPAGGPSLVSVLLWVIAIGVTLRGIWLLVGLQRLRRLRAGSSPIVLDDGIEALRLGLAPNASIRSHERVSQPVTFGLRRPIVLVPPALATMAADTQGAVVCHELLHVNRRDWLSTIGEELVRIVLWFHPAIHWALDQAQCSREELVDAQAVAITGARRSYMNALLAFANRPALAPATLFARRNHLAVRIRRIAEEVPMSRRRMVAAGAALVSVLVTSTWRIVSALPLTAAAIAQAPAPPSQGAVLRTYLSPDGIRIQISSRSMPRPAGGLQPIYPPDLRRLGVGATVTLTLNVNAAGQVAIVGDPQWQLTIRDSGFLVKTARVDRNSVDDMQRFWAGKPWVAFVEAAATAAQQWTFEPAAGESTVTLSMTFINGPDDTVLMPPPPPPPPPPQTSRPGAIGPVAGAGASSPGQVPTKAPPPPPPPPPPLGTEALRVGGAVRAPRQISSVPPVYPPIARAAHVQGVVILETRIDHEGSVADVRVLRSIPLLDAAAVEAVRQWKFEPVLLNGAPVDVLMAISLSFTLPPEP